MRRLNNTAALPLDERSVLLLLLGHDVPGQNMKDLLFIGNVVRTPELWRTHEMFLLAEAERRGIARPAGGYFGERVLAEREDAARKWALRQGHVDDDRAS